MKDFSPLGITSAAVGFPARICVITRRDGTVYRIAESDTSITVGSDTFVPVPGITISAVKHTNNGEMPSCQIVAMHNSGSTFDTLQIDAGLYDAATVQIYIVDRLNLSRKGLLFTGSFADITYTNENQVSIDVKGPAVGAKILMTQKRSPMCRTDLFSVLCQLTAASYAVSTAVASVSDAFSFTVTGSLAQADGYFNQGVCVTASGVSFEIGSWTHSTQKITCYQPVNRILSGGEGLTLYPGCDKTLGSTGCAKFSNQINFQAEPHFLGVSAASQTV